MLACPVLLCVSQTNKYVVAKEEIANCYIYALVQSSA
jgi:hypothetical protein